MLKCKENIKGNPSQGQGTKIKKNPGRTPGQARATPPGDAAIWPRRGRGNIASAGPRQYCLGPRAMQGPGAPGRSLAPLHSHEPGVRTSVWSCESNPLKIYESANELGRTAATTRSLGRHIIIFEFMFDLI